MKRNKFIDQSELSNIIKTNEKSIKKLEDEGIIVGFGEKKEDIGRLK